MNDLKDKLDMKRIKLADAEIRKNQLKRKLELEKVRDYLNSHLT